MKKFLMIHNVFSIRAIIRQSWAVFVREWKVLVGATLVYGAVSMLTSQESDEWALIVISFLINIVIMYLYFGVIRISLRMIRGTSYAWDTLRTDAKTVVRILLASLMYSIPFLVIAAALFFIVGPSLFAVAGPIGLGVGGVIALILTILAALIYSLRFGLYIYFIIDRNESPKQSLISSMKATKGSVARLVLFMILAIFVLVIASIPFGLGLLVALPMFLIAQSAIYERLATHMHGESKEFPIAQPAEISAPEETPAVAQTNEEEIKKEE